MKTRKLSKRYVSERFTEMQETLAAAKAAMEVLPHSDDFNQVRLPYGTLKAMIKNRKLIAYAEGFFEGWSLAKGDQS